MKASLTALIVFVLSLCPTFVSEVDGQPVSEGDHVRITVPTLPGSPLVGRINSLQGDTLVLQNEDWSFQTVAFNDIEQLEVSTGIISHELEGLFLGALLGGAVAYGACKAISEEPQSGEWGVVGCELATPLGASLGALIGLGLGAATKTYQWEVVPTTMYLGLGVPGDTLIRLRINL